MKTKPSIGIITIGVIVIVTSLLSLFMFLNPKPYLEMYVKPFGIILYVVSFPITLFEIILGFNILKLKEWARRYFVIWTVFSCILIAVIPFMEDKNFRVSFKQQFNQNLEQYSPEIKRKMDEIKIRIEENVKRYPPEQQERIRQMQYIFLEDMPIILLRSIQFFIYGLFLIWNLFLIFFFTRRRVKAQFGIPHAEVVKRAKNW